MSGAQRNGAVRPGEELDVDRVDRWLRALEPDLEGPPEVTQYAGGVSNWTYRLRYRNRDLVLRRPPAGTKAKSAHDMAREYRIQKALKPAYPVVPTMVGLCEDESVLGADFYVMERVEGLIPRARLPEGVRLSPADTRRLCTSLLDKLIELHGVDARAVGLDTLSKGAGYTRRQVEGWSARYEKARTWNVPSYRYVRAWLQERTPDDIASCVIHNDWRFDNVVLEPGDPTRIVGVLDWELATVGDPLMDLGSALAYWVEAVGPSAHPPDPPCLLSRAASARALLGAGTGNVGCSSYALSLSSRTHTWDRRSPRSSPMASWDCCMFALLRLGERQCPTWH